VGLLSRRGNRGILGRKYYREGQWGDELALLDTKDRHRPRGEETKSLQNLVHQEKESP